MIRGTTILSVRKDGVAVVIGDGQVTYGEKVVLKSGAKKVRRILDGQVVCGFAGSTADAITLYEKLEDKLRSTQGNLLRASVELAKEWRSDRTLRQLEALLIAANSELTLLISGNGDVIEPEGGIVAIGSGGNFALAAAKALVKHTELSAHDIALNAMKIAAEMCVFTNDVFTIEEIQNDS